MCDELKRVRKWSRPLGTFHLEPLRDVMRLDQAELRTWYLLNTSQLHDYCFNDYAKARP